MKYCKQCGVAINDNTLKKCSKCNTTIGKGGRFCENCGAKIVPGKPCRCHSKGLTTEKEQVVQVKDAGAPVVKELPKPPVNENPVVNRRVSSNPLFAKIAREGEESSKSTQIIQREAVKIVNQTGALMKQFQPEEVISPTNNEKTSPEISAPKVSENPAPELKPKVEENRKILKKDIQPASPIIPIPKPAATTSPEVVDSVKNTIAPQPVGPSPAQAAFKDAFNEQNMEIPKQPLVTPISKQIYHDQPQKAKRIKNNFEGLWLAAAMLGAFGMLFHASPILFYLNMGLSLIFGLLDTIVNKKRTGCGAMIAVTVAILFTVFSKYFGI